MLHRRSKQNRRDIVTTEIRILQKCMAAEVELGLGETASQPAEVRFDVDSYARRSLAGRCRGSYVDDETRSSGLQGSELRERTVIQQPPEPYRDMHVRSAAGAPVALRLLRRQPTQDSAVRLRDGVQQVYEPRRDPR
jgi:hypothetical protein